MPDTTAELEASVENAYRVFAAYELGSSLSVCHCPVCMSEGEERELLTTELREIPSALLSEYTNSAHGWDDGEIARDMKHFLPRYLELIAADDAPDAIGPDICLRRLAESAWRKRWPAAECDAIGRFFDALLRHRITDIVPVRSHYGWRLGRDLSDVLTLVVTAGGDLERALSLLEGGPDPQVAIHLAALRAELRSTDDGLRLSTAFLDGELESALRIGAFLMRQEVTRRIEARFFAIDDEGLLAILSAGHSMSTTD